MSDQAAKECCVCGALLTDHVCLSCGHEECEKCSPQRPEVPDKWRGTAAQIDKGLFGNADSTMRLMLEEIAALAAERDALKTQVERLSAPVSDEEWRCLCRSSPYSCGIQYLSDARRSIGELIAARKATPTAEQG